MGVLMRTGWPSAVRTAWNRTFEPVARRVPRTLYPGMSNMDEHTRWREPVPMTSSHQHARLYAFVGEQVSFPGHSSLKARLLVTTRITRGEISLQNRGW